MLGTTSVTIEIGGKTITMETGLLAKQASGSVIIRTGDNVLLSATTISKSPREGIDWFPLQVEYREKFYATGRFPGGFFKRESRPGEFEILTARATDRPLRPLFPEGFCNDVQIFNQLLSADGEEIVDILNINGASASLVLSDAPFQGPIGAVRIGRVEGEFVINPSHEQMETSDLNLTYVGTRDLPAMIEGDAQEISEADMLAAMKLAHEAVVQLVDAQLELRRKAGKPEKVIELPESDDSLYERAKAEIGTTMREALSIVSKGERETRVHAVKDEWTAKLLEEDENLNKKSLVGVYDRLEIEIVRKNVLENKQRIDGRAFDEVRPLSGAVSVLPRTHGSSVFTRGETQSLATVTLGTLSDAQKMDAIAGGPDSKRFMLHYNFPPFSVGEAGRIMGPGRREVGHGNLAERSLRPIMPEDYAYTVRVVSEILESNGSSSMASICAGTLALMDAGVPITKPVAGISIGLFTDENGNGELVADILGTEDHCGDMDWKVAGTRDGITGFQVDLKLHGLKWEFVERAFEMARQARYKILDAMAEVLEAPRPDVADHAPRIEDLQIPPDKIGALIGPGGKNIRGITETYDVQIDVEEDGKVHVFGLDREKMDAAVKEITMLTAEAEVGKLYQGTVRSIKDFGAFVEIIPGKDGLVHISELADFRVGSVEDICKEGDLMWVKCLDVDETGRIRLSRRAALADKDEEDDKKPSGAEAQSSDRGGDRRGGGGGRGGDRRAN